MTEGPIPPPRGDDDEDVHWALSTACALWARGEQTESVRWLRRAAEQASDAGAEKRSLELAKAAADATSLLAAGATPQPGPAAETPRPPPLRSAPPPSGGFARPSQTPPPPRTSQLPGRPSAPPGRPPPPPPSRRGEGAGPRSAPSGALPGRISTPAPQPGSGRVPTPAGSQPGARNSPVPAEPRPVAAPGGARRGPGAIEERGRRRPDDDDETRIFAARPPPKPVLALQVDPTHDDAHALDAGGAHGMEPEMPTAVDGPADDGAWSDKTDAQIGPFSPQPGELRAFLVAVLPAARQGELRLVPAHAAPPGAVVAVLAPTSPADADAIARMLSTAPRG